VLAGRSRIVALLGRGGMGEVYRADDLTLGQAVALKFLPARVASDSERLARFRSEVRVARQVSHPNVCRVYDVGEADGQPFLSMEYIDGEDLASLLRRIGRLPEERGVEVAWQLCLALAAAHEKGLLHRDLKPGNVMIDGRGQVRLTDFGLAGLAQEFHGTEVRAGTPAYMAPKQRAGKEVTVQSDLYALGLILYELFTGKPPFQAKNREELARLHEEATPSKPSTLVGVLHRVGQRGHQLRRRPRWHWLGLRLEPGGERAARAVGRGDVAERASLADFVDRHHVGMIQPGSCLPLAQEALAQVGVDHGLGARDLWSHLSAQERIDGQVDDAITTAA
jgi:serine/threonine protein kinase